MGKKDFEFPKLSKTPKGFLQPKEQESCEATISDPQSELMVKAGTGDPAAEMLRRFVPTCSMNDRASTARKAARWWPC